MKTNRGLMTVLATLLVLSLAFGLAGCATTDDSDVEYSDYFTVPELIEGGIMATALKVTLESNSDETWATVLMAGFYYTFDYGNPGQRIAVIMSFEDGTSQAYIVEYDTFDDYQNDYIDSDEFIDSISVVDL